MNRRDFLKALGIGGLAVVAPELIEPERKLWFVPSSAPVGSRVERLGGGILTAEVARSWKLSLALAEEALEDEKFPMVLEHARRSKRAMWEAMDRDAADAVDALHCMYGGARGGGKSGRFVAAQERALTSEQNRRVLRGIWDRAEREGDATILRAASAVPDAGDDWVFRSGFRYHFGKG